MEGRGAKWIPLEEEAAGGAAEATMAAGMATNAVGQIADRKLSRFL